MNDHPQVMTTAAQKTAWAVQHYLEQCSRSERWPDGAEVDRIFAEHFAPIIRNTKAERLVIATHEHLLPLLRLYGEKDDHPVMQAIRAYVAKLTA